MACQQLRLRAVTSFSHHAGVVPKNDASMLVLADSCSRPAPRAEQSSTSLLPGQHSLGEIPIVAWEAASWLPALLSAESVR